jgi:hypothetical protein
LRLRGGSCAARPSVSPIAELAGRAAGTAIQIALAYVLAQKGRVIPLIEPRLLSELNDSLDAFSVKLSSGDVQWLRDGAPGPVERGLSRNESAPASGAGWASEVWFAPQETSYQLNSLIRFPAIK